MKPEAFTRCSMAWALTRPGMYSTFTCSVAWLAVAGRDIVVLTVAVVSACDKFVAVFRINVKIRRPS